MFLSSMAPQLVQLAEEHAKVAADLTSRYGIASVVRAIEVLGEALLDIRRAPDPRLVLEVTLVRLASNTVANDTASLLARVERLESGGAPARPRDVTGPIPRPRLVNTDVANAVRRSPAQSATLTRAAERVTSQQAPSGPVDDLVAAWPGIVRTLKATVRALYSAVEVVGVDGDTFTVAAPSDMHKKKCLELKDNVQTALSSAAGRTITLDIQVQPPRTSATVANVKAAAADVEQHTDDLVDDNGDAAPVESVVDQIAKSFPGARIVDSSKN
jgi:DNA polymerase-3 subunit gamma/tau